MGTCLTLRKRPGASHVKLGDFPYDFYSLNKVSVQSTDIPKITLNGRDQGEAPHGPSFLMCDSLAGYRASLLWRLFCRSWRIFAGAENVSR